MIPSDITLAAYGRYLPDGPRSPSIATIAALPAYANLRANAQLVFDGSPGRATEVLSGRYYTPVATSSSHQIWSSAMIVSPLLRGMMGLTVDATNSTVRFEPHVPADWTDFAIRNVAMGAASEADSLTLSYHRGDGDITLDVARRGLQPSQLEFCAVLQSPGPRPERGG